MSPVSFSKLYFLGILCGLCCLRATTWWWRRWGKPLLTEDPPACMSRIIHFQKKENTNLTDIVSIKVSSALSSKHVCSAVRRTKGWQRNGRCEPNETAFIKIRTSVGFATVQTPCNRKADMGRHYFFKISATDDKSFCGSSELPLSWNVKY